MLWYQSIPLWFQKIFPKLVWQKSNTNRTVFLTFDDGPHPEITPWVLQQLDTFGAKATFFCVGENVLKYSDTYQTILAQGHKTGNHTMHHIKGWKTGTDTYLDNIKQCSKLVKSNLFRPPYGRIKSKQVIAIGNTYDIIMWSLLSCDFDKNLDTKKALAGLKRKTKSGSIIVFHDSLKAEKNLKEMLPLYLHYLNDKGFNCKVL